MFQDLHQRDRQEREKQTKSAGSCFVSGCARFRGGAHGLRSFSVNAFCANT